ncbi:MAG: hypothetical protein KAJ86_04140 [Alphaproteobacteria bacterium]|nr:hypothetical protein [Alphaproteobacteria bacterium]
MSVSKERTISIFLAFAVLLNISVWFYARDMKSQWLNVPPTPSTLGASAFAMGDKQLAYRSIAIMLQNLGDTGGRSTAFTKYNYEELSKWLFLTRDLDAKSNHIPFLASFYFGSTPDVTQLPLLLDYLHVAGQTPGGKRWRWLVQAIYLARFKMNDLDRALKYAKTLAELENPDMPTWTRQMPAFVMNAKGNKEEAIGMLLEILNSGEDHLHPNEINHTREYICTRILDEKEAASNPLCENLPF